MSRKAAFLSMRHLGQDVPHEVDLTALPGGAQPLLSDGGLDAGVGVRDAERGPFHPPALELPEKDAPGVLRLVEHGLCGQDLPAPGLVHPAGDHHGHRDHPPLDPDLLVQGVDPEERILFGQGPGPKIGNLGVELLVELRDLGGGDVLDAHRSGQPLDLPGRDPVNEGLLHDRDERLLGPPSLRDEEWDVAALPDLGHEKIDRPQTRINPPGPRPGKIRRPLPRVFPLCRPDLGFRLDPHHLRHHPLEHRQERVRFRNELQ